ncbi:hypothetical protein KHA94_00890 [Bacillus sp. FJAT-49705]|uniref:Uncharacterized protein n=1 Tax=Cytobacillus citreus TaxID=2833586 RepID=A0ABS5NMS8_9BACI|nr:hypothetical protein [Cytobacillus citreus]MBS4188774.1 hypothetical protein [Cytobacillus citreus]
MAGLTAGVFTIGAVLIAGGIYFILAITKPGVYPPKYILKKRAVSLAAGGIAFLLIGIIMSSFQ